MKRIIKETVHSITIRPPGWLVLRQITAWDRIGRLDPVLRMVAPPPNRFPTDDRFVCRRDGALFEFNRSNYFQWARSLGVFDEVGAAIKDLIRRRGAFIDVGANVGYYTVLASRWGTSTKRVIAIEPGSEARRRLVRHLQANGCGDVELIEAALSDTRGEALLCMDPRGDIGKTTLRSGPEVERGGEVVETTTLDTIWHGLGRPCVGLVKIDVEGLEGEVLVGALDMMGRERPAMIVEITPGINNPNLVTQAIRELHDLGYGWTTASDMAAGTRGIRRGDVLSTLNGQANVVFLPDESSIP